MRPYSAAWALKGAAQRFREQARRWPDAMAVEAGDGAISYAALDRWVDELAGQLPRGSGEQAIAVAIGRSPAQVAAALAVLRVGACYLPIDVEAPPRRNRMILQDAGPAVLMHDRSRSHLSAGVAGPAVEVPGAPELTGGLQPALEPDRGSSPASRPT